MNQIDMSEKRTTSRQPFQKECILINHFGSIKAQTVDISKWGMGVLVSGQMPIEKDGILFVDIKSLNYSSHAEVCWTKKDNDSTRVGLFLLNSLAE